MACRMRGTIGLTPQVHRETMVHHFNGIRGWRQVSTYRSRHLVGSAVRKLGCWRNHVNRRPLDLAPCGVDSWHCLLKWDTITKSRRVIAKISFSDFLKISHKDDILLWRGVPFSVFYIAGFVMSTVERWMGNSMLYLWHIFLFFILKRNCSIHWKRVTIILYKNALL